MRKAIVNFFIALGLLLALVGCKHLETLPTNVTFKNATLKGSENYTITVVYQEDKRVREYYTDLFISSNTDNTNLTITQELGNTWQINLPNKDEWYSLTELRNEQEDFATFATVETTTFIINSPKKVELTIKAVGGNLNTTTKTLINLFDVSSPFKIKIEQTTQNT